MSGKSWCVMAALAEANPYPAQFTGRFHGYVAILLAMQVGYLALRGWKLRWGQDRSFLVLQDVLTLLLVVLSVVVAEYGKSYGVFFEAVPDTGRLARLGEAVFPYGIVLLAAAELGLNVWIRFRQRGSWKGGGRG